MKDRKLARTNMTEKCGSAMVECSFNFGRNNPYQPGAIETDTKAAASYYEYRIDLVSFAAVSIHPSVFWQNS